MMILNSALLTRENGFETTESHVSIVFCIEDVVRWVVFTCEIATIIDWKRNIYNASYKLRHFPFMDVKSQYGRWNHKEYCAAANWFVQSIFRIFCIWFFGCGIDVISTKNCSNCGKCWKNWLDIRTKIEIYCG